MSEAIGDRLGVARGLGSLGVVADSQGDYPQALKYYRQCLEQFEALKDKGGIARTIDNIAIVYEERDLVGLFGAEYEAYRSRVGKLVPKFRRS